jgi:hypothetical protein
MAISDEYVSQTDLGTLFGSNSHIIGRILKKLGYRTTDGKPSPLAFQEGLIGLRDYESQPDHPLVTWHREKTIAILQKQGLKLVHVEEEDDLPSDEHRPYQPYSEKQREEVGRRIQENARRYRDMC